ncbi:MAG: FimV/HubP family polar landmark protein [Pseudomonadota bacterium]
MQKGEADSLSVQLPSAEAFRQANIEYSGALLSVRFSLEQRGEDRHVIVLSSAQPMNEPFLDLLVQLDWAGGRLVREYTFLLDPPEYKPPQPAPAVAAPAESAAPVIMSVEVPKQPELRPRVPGMDKPLEPAAPKAASTYQVKRGDTLVKIANANRSYDVSLQQMLLALYRSNTDAFDGNNMNRLRAGKILNIPDKDAAASVDQSEATRLLIAQVADFNEYRRNLAAAVAAAPERADSLRRSASGKITAKVEDKPAVAMDTGDQLRLSKAEEPGKPGASRSAQGLREDLFAKDKAIKDANERIAMLEKNVQELQKLLELKSQSGALLQQQAAKAGAAKVAEPAKAPEVAKDAAAAKAPELAKATVVAKAGEPARAGEPAKPAPKAASKVVTPPPPPPEPGLVDEILGNELALYGGGGFLLLLFGGYGYYAWRRKKTLQKTESGVMGAPGLATDSVFGASGRDRVDTGPVEIQGDFSRGGAAVAIDTGEVDPIAEADVYMAYGRDAQAEEILKEALAKDPSRQAIRIKLLEIYAGRKDAKAFEAVAVELQAATGGAGTEWGKAVALGLQLDPKNPLYGGKTAAGETPRATDTQVLSAAEVAAAAAPAIGLDAGVQEPAAFAGLDFDLGLSSPAEAGAQPGIAPDSGTAPATDVTADLGFDLDLDLGGGEKPPEVAAGGTPSLDAQALGVPEAAASVDFDFELPAAGDAAKTEQAHAPGELPIVTAAASAGPAEGSDGIDFDFNLDLPAQKQEAPAAPTAPAGSAEGGGGIDFDFNVSLQTQKEEAPAAPIDLSSISLDLGAPGAEAAPADARWQEVATKLDLAKAYQEMGDKDGARELLKEVLNEGDAAQQQQAQTMLSAQD